MRMERALLLRFLREGCHPRIDENLKLDTSPCEEHRFVRLLCGLSSSNADKMLPHPWSCRTNLKHCYLPSSPSIFLLLWLSFRSSFPLEIALCFELEQKWEGKS